MRFINAAAVVVVTAIFSVSPAEISMAREIVLYSFEKDPQGWEIPDWALSKKDNAGRQIGISEFQSSDGKYSLQIDTEFAGGSSWEGAYVERVTDVSDWSPFSSVSFDIFLPKDAPQGLRARIILVTGEDWAWTEMNRPVPLAPGEWTVIKADITATSMNWRRFVDENFRKDIRKIGIRIESNGRITYKGPVYIDNVKLTD